MKSIVKKYSACLSFRLLVLCLGAVSCFGGETNSTGDEPLLQDMSHREVVLRAMLNEANLYAKELHLSENMPIEQSALTEVFVSPLQFADQFGTLGSLRTTNYSYAFGRGRRLTYITRLPRDKSGKPLYERFKPWRIEPSAINTNAAYTVATQFLSAAFIDLPKLLQSNEVSIRPLVILDMTTSVYRLEWKQAGNNVVEVGLDEPTKELWLLRVEDPGYILRPPLVSTALTNLPSPSGAAARSGQ